MQLIVYILQLEEGKLASDLFTKMIHIIKQRNWKKHHFRETYVRFYNKMLV